MAHDQEMAGIVGPYQYRRDLAFFGCGDESQFFLHGLIVAELAKSSEAGKSGRTAGMFRPQGGRFQKNGDPRWRVGLVWTGMQTLAVWRLLLLRQARGPEP